jgi:hypothetical protein
MKGGPIMLSQAMIQSVVTVALQNEAKDYRL